MEETPTYNTGETPSRITVPWPEFNDVMQLLGMTVQYSGKGQNEWGFSAWYQYHTEDKAKFTEHLMFPTKIKITEDAALGLIFLLEHQYEYKRIDARDHEHYRRVLLGWVNG